MLSPFRFWISSIRLRSLIINWIWKSTAVFHVFLFVFFLFWIWWSISIFHLINQIVQIHQKNDFQRQINWIVWQNVIHLWIRTPIVCWKSSNDLSCKSFVKISCGCKRLMIGDTEFLICWQLKNRTRHGSHHFRSFFKEVVIKLPLCKWQ